NARRRRRRTARPVPRSRTASALPGDPAELVQRAAERRAGRVDVDCGELADERDRALDLRRFGVEVAPEELERAVERAVEQRFLAVDRGDARERQLELELPAREQPLR